MADGTGWKRHRNLLWHWSTHAQPFVSGGTLVSAEMSGITSERVYLALARKIAKSGHC